MRTATPALLVLFTGCVNLEENETTLIDAGAISRTVADIQQGDFGYSGRPANDRFTIDSRRWAWGSSRKKVTRKFSDARLETDTTADELRVTVHSSYEQAGVDVEVMGPQIIDLDVNTSSSHNISVADVLGSLSLTGGKVTAQGIEGEVRVVAESDVNVEVYPFEWAIVDVVSEEGDCVVYLPKWAPISVVARWHVDQAGSVADLGWDEEYLDAGYYEGLRYPGDIVVDIQCGEGSLEIREHDFTW